jgi:hypothetical protein
MGKAGEIRVVGGGFSEFGGEAAELFNVASGLEFLAHLSYEAASLGFAVGAGEVIFDLNGDGSEGLGPVFGVVFQASFNYIREGRRGYFGKGLIGIEESRLDNFVEVVATVGGESGENFVKESTNEVDIGGYSKTLGCIIELFWSHIGWCSGGICGGELPRKKGGFEGLGDICSHGVGEGSAKVGKALLIEGQEFIRHLRLLEAQGQTPISEEDFTVVSHHYLSGFEVSMDDAMIVGIDEGIEDLDENLEVAGEEFFLGEFLLSVFMKKGSPGGSGDLFHNQHGLDTILNPGGSDAMNRNDIWMIEAGNGEGLGQKILQIPCIGVGDFESNGALEIVLPSFIDNALAPFSKKVRDNKGFALGPLKLDLGKTIPGLGWRSRQGMVRELGNGWGPTLPGHGEGDHIARITFGAGIGDGGEEGFGSANCVGKSRYGISSRPRGFGEF